LPCPECENRFREYLIFRSAVVRFANYLDDLEGERRRILEASQPQGAPPLPKVKAVLRDKRDPQERERRHTDADSLAE
jgi:hypothetical protein